MLKRQRISITGRVQGVGFRPAVYRIASDLALAGLVYNDTKGVTVELQGTPEKIQLFIETLNSEKACPPLAKITSCTTADIDLIEGQTDFTILSSDSTGTALSQVTADSAACPDCLAEMSDKKDFRYRYPFINCTNCGPRYSIVKTIPYDRPNTTMSVFKMCDKCAAQYTDVTDRRFHAQPVACANCGPNVWLTDNNGQTIQSKTDPAIAATAKLLKDGKIAAIKGIGGFHLAVDASNESAVQRLRTRKKRDAKPFALMTDSIEKINRYAHITESARRILQSPQSPVVLLPKKQNAPIAKGVADGVNCFGFMLCYAPLHFLLFANDIDVLIMTSANISDEPLICDNQLALEKLSSVADVFLMHDREIYRQLDDSIVHIIADQPALLRRARGYVPSPIITDQACDKDIFAAGSDLKNTFCFAKQNQLISSEHIGDLADASVYHHYLESVEHLRTLFEVRPQIVACDLHPGYLSTAYASSLKAEKTIHIQHHWAHVASVLAEHNRSGPAIGLVCDGTGYGTDGAVWGCECLIADLQNFERFAHLSYFQLPGANCAAKEPIRPLLGLLKKTHPDKLRSGQFDSLLDQIEPDADKRNIICDQIDKAINTVNTSSLGRLFDAVAAMLGLGTLNRFEAELPMALEAIADESIKQAYDFELLETPDKPLELDVTKMLDQLISDIKQGVDNSAISAKFHNSIAAALLATAEKARKKTKLDTVAISGGVFCNRFLANRLINLLNKNNFSVLWNQQLPSNDGAIALGQAAIAATLANSNKDKL